MNTGAWEHKWSFSPQTNTSGPRDRTVDLPPDVGDELRRVRAEARATQAANDRLRFELANAYANASQGRHGHPSGSNTDRQKGGKGKGWKGSGKDKGHRNHSDRERSSRRDRDRRDRR